METISDASQRLQRDVLGVHHSLLMGWNTLRFRTNQLEASRCGHLFPKLSDHLILIEMFNTILHFFSRSTFIAQTEAEKPHSKV